MGHFYLGHGLYFLGLNFMLDIVYRKKACYFSFNEFMPRIPKVSQDGGYLNFSKS